MKLSFSINATSDFIFDYLTDMQKFASVHPVISKIDKTGIDSYLVHETLTFCGVPFSFTYPVTIESNSIKMLVIMRATVMKFTRIEMTYVIMADKDFTLIEENIQFQSPFPLKSIMQYVFKKQHTQLFKNIEQKTKVEPLSS